MRVRGLKLDDRDVTGWIPPSHPMRVRGLKLRDAAIYRYMQTSHPMRVRGLKSQRLYMMHCISRVAPHAGA